MLPLNEILIREARRLSLDDDYGAEYGVQQDTYVPSLKKAAQLVQAYLVNEGKEPFPSFSETSVAQVGGEWPTAYDLPEDSFGSGTLYAVQFSRDGSAPNYIDLEVAFEREPEESGDPEEYYLENGRFYPCPTPTSTGGKFRMRYEKALPEMDIRRGTIESLGNDGTYHTITLYSAATGLRVAPHTSALTGTIGDWITIINDAGGVGEILQSVFVNDYNEGTFTITTGVLIAETLSASVGNQIAIGKNATIRSSLPSLFRSFFVEFMKADVYEAISSTDVMEANPKLSALLTEIVKLYGTHHAGKIRVPQRRGGY